MMYKVEMSAQFRRDLKTARKRGYDIDRLDAVIELLSNGVSLPLKNRDHNLTGNFGGFRECHIAPDWLLVYRLEHEILVLYLLRTGTHSDISF